MSSAKFKKLLGDMQECIKDSKIELESKDKHQMGGWAARKTAAINKLEELRREYLSEIGENLTHIFLVGPQEDTTRFGLLSKEFGGCFWVDGSDIAKHLASKVESNLLLNKQVSIDHLLTLGYELDKMYEEIGLSRTLVELTPGMYRVCNNKEDVLGLVKDFLAVTATLEFTLKRLQWTVAQAALEEKFDKDLVPVVVSGLSSMEVDDTNKIKNRYVVKVGQKKVDKTLVFETLKKIKDLIKPE